MPEKRTAARARRDLRQGKSPSTAAGEFVKEEMDHIRSGKHGAKSAKQAVAIGLDVEPVLRHAGHVREHGDALCVLENVDGRYEREIIVRRPLFGSRRFAVALVHRGTTGCDFLIHIGSSLRVS